MIGDLDKLIELQQTDTNLFRLRKQLETADARRAEIEHEFEQHAFSIREVQTKRDTLHAKRADLEKQIAENRTYLERADRNLKHAQNQKEYETAMREVDSLQKQIATFETQIVEAMEDVEAIDQEILDRADEISSHDGKREAALAAFDSELAANKAEFESETGHREKAFAVLPEKLAAIYDRLTKRSRDGIAVAEVVNGSCSACFISLRPQMQVNVRKGEEIIICENCSRILYIQDRGSEASA